MEIKKEGTQSSLIETFFPFFCFGCQKEGSCLCSDCRTVLEVAEHIYCLCEKNPLRLPPESKNGKCQKCRNKALSGLRFALSYKERALTRMLIRNFKYEPFVKILAKTLAELIAEHFAKAEKNIYEFWQGGILVPVPLEKRKMKWRGYNQSEELAKELSFLFATPLVGDVLIKTRETPPQMELTKEERERNLAGVFAVQNKEEIKGKKVFLVDDVYTTGSTMEECARALRQSDAKSVWGIAVAREE